MPHSEEALRDFSSTCFAVEHHDESRLAAGAVLCAMLIVQPPVVSCGERRLFSLSKKHVFLSGSLSGGLCQRVAEQVGVEQTLGVENRISLEALTVFSRALWNRRGCSPNVP